MKHKILFIAGIPIFLFAFLFNLTISLAQDEAIEVYKDKKNYFSFNPPPGWIKEEIVNDTMVQVSFSSPDGKAALGVIAELNDGDLNDLFLQKKEYIKDYRRRFPRGKFSLFWDSLGKRKVVKINFEIPQVIKQEQYFFYDQGIRFDLVYGVGNSADFEKYNQLVLDAFATVQRQKLIMKK